MTLDEMIAVIKAYGDGKPLQFRLAGNGGEWEDYRIAYFRPSFSSYDYRIKPEPSKPRKWDLRGWHVYEVGGAGSINALSDVGNEPIRVREVLEGTSVPLP